MDIHSLQCFLSLAQYLNYTKTAEKEHLTNPIQIHFFPKNHLLELISMSDRILVVKKGQIEGELVGEQITEQEIIRRALGVNRNDAEETTY